jgi:hypothetical protein
VRPFLLSVSTALVCAALSAPAMAQAPLPANARGVPMGPVTMFPALAFDYSYNDNVFYASQEDQAAIIPSGLYGLEPKFLFDLPIGESDLRWTYGVLLRHYDSAEYATASGNQSRRDDNSQKLDVDGTFHLGPSARLMFFEHLLKGTQELRSVDPGGEAVFGTVPFLFNDAALELQWDVSGRSGFSVRPRYSSTHFSETANAVFYNYNTTGLEGRYNHRLSPETIFYVSYSQEQTDQSRTGASLFGDVTVDTQRAGVGLTRTVNRAVTARAFVGYTREDFTGGAPSDFSGLTMDVGAGWLLTDVLHLDLSLRQEPYQSFYINNNYYLNRLANLTVTRQMGQRILLRAGLGFEQNDYSDALEVTPDFQALLCSANDPSDCPSAGTVRRDRVVRYEAAVAYQLRPTMRWSLGYNHESRDSNVVHWLVDPGTFYDPFDYRAGRLYVRFEMGWM